ncbi:FAD-binding oxidoreductase [Larkinella terrae]|uniref:FAD-binding oxidoreductase n=1 Tax=Larkinella terrae TaxID=2025311 RepID=A0A7K0EUB8_9BACT|nr:FAD-binding oxidoreductase [Larkinella terrae]MRS65349.1 FAD-binding oxidoreductase [Larkinella terrae]
MPQAIYFIFMLLMVAGTSEAQLAASGSRQPLTYKNRQIVVGKGGGFTGATTSYYLLENGSLYRKSDADSVFTPLGKKSLTATRRLFKELETGCRIKTTRFSKPGNLYQFVSWKKNQQEFTVSWGDPRQPPPPRFVKFYKSFMALIPTSKATH